jgi:signal transduction histidine kinase
LNAIIGFSQIIRDGLFGPIGARYRDYANDVHSSGQHLLRLINDVLDLSKIEVGRLEMHEEEVHLPSLVDACCRLLAPKAETAQIVIDVALPPALPSVLADHLRLKQIVLNLLSNAVKFTPPGGRVTVAARMPAAGGINLSIADTGIGMSADEIPIALAPFEQIESSLTRRYEGTGLGLPLAKVLTELHGGTLEIASEKGGGTTVTVHLPKTRVLLPTRGTALGPTAPTPA